MQRVWRWWCDNDVDFFDDGGWFDDIDDGGWFVGSGSSVVVFDDSWQPVSCG